MAINDEVWVVRPVTIADIDAVVKIAESLGSGMTTFPPNREVITNKIEISEASFDGSLSGVEAQYFMVLEQVSTGALIGVSAVYPSIGHPHGFFSWHIDRLITHSKTIETQFDSLVLNLSNAYTGLTEIGTLAVNPEFRKGGAGKLLARSRYMLMACFPNLFADRVIAEMRGWQEDEGVSPVWSAIGEKFFKIDFQAADVLSAVEGAEFIANLFPRFPIYADLLPREAQDALGKPHKTSAIAMRLLGQEGFRFENYIDVFDGGPQVVCPLKEIATVKNSFTLTLTDKQCGDEARDLLISTTDLDNFRMIRTRAATSGGNVKLSDDEKEALNISSGDIVRCCEV